jgi:hypothetical protein
VGDGWDEVLVKHFAGRHVCRVLLVLVWCWGRRGRSRERRGRKRNKRRKRPFKNSQHYFPCLTVSLFFQGSVHPFLAELSSLCLLKIHSWPSLHTSGGFI